MKSALVSREQTKSEPDSVSSPKARTHVTAGTRWPITLMDARPPALRLRYSTSPCHTALLHALQAKLTVNEPGDQYEQEADRVAEQVMRMPDTTLRLQRKCGCGGSTASGESCEECASPHVQLQRRATPENSSSVAAAPPVVHDVLRSSGQPLDTSTRAFMEPRFGHTFDQVRVHTDERAAESARAVNALAFTVGVDVVFGHGEYLPQTFQGRSLLAHELAHVVQQSASRGHPASGVKVAEENTRKDEAHAWASGAVPPHMRLPLSDHRSNISLQRQQPAVGSGAPPVYMCSKSLETSPLGTHVFFRVGGTGPGNPTYSLEPEDRGGNCWQGQPKRDYPADFTAASARCISTPISLSCLQSQYAAYPIGHYCTFGPNSNSFAGSIARSCGMRNPDPPGWNPGIDEGPPPAGTYAPSPGSTFFGCTTKACGRDTGPVRCEPRYLGYGERLGEDCIVRVGAGPKF